MSNNLYQENFLTDTAVLSILQAVQQEAHVESDPICVAIVDQHGGLQGFLRMNNASFTSRTIAINKATTAAGLNLTTEELGQIMKEHQLPASHYGDDRITGFGGGLPIIINGKLVGGIGVSGLSDAQDIAYCEIGLVSIKGG